jgi:hypothetical protein
VDRSGDRGAIDGDAAFGHHLFQVPETEAVSEIPSGSVANPLFQSFSYEGTGSETEGGVFKGRHFDRSVILLCIRWYLAYNLSLRNLEEMMAERGVTVDHATIHRWTIHYAPLLLEQFNRRKRPVGASRHTLIDMPSAGDRTLSLIELLEEERRIVDDPAVDRGVIDRDAALSHHLFEVPQLRLYAGYHRTHRRITERSKWRPLNI